MRCHFFTIVAIAALFADQASKVAATETEAFASVYEEEYFNVFAQLTEEDQELQLAQLRSELLALEEEYNFAQLDEDKKEDDDEEDSEDSEEGDGDDSDSDTSESDGDDGADACGGDGEATPAATAAQVDAAADSEADSGSESGLEDDFFYAQIDSESGSEIDSESEVDSDGELEFGFGGMMTSGSFQMNSSGFTQTSEAELELAETGIELEDDEYYTFTQTMTQTQAEENIEYLGNFLAQLGIEDSHELLAQLSAEVDADQMQYMATNPDIYFGLAQIAEEYHSGQEEALAQTEVEEALF